MISTNIINNNTTTTTTTMTTTMTTMTTTNLNTNTNPNLNTNTNPNLFRVANENELALHEQAVILIREIYNQDINRTNSIYSCQFKPQTTRTQVIRVDNLIYRFIEELRLLENQQALPTKKRAKNTKKTYNSCLNLLLAVVSEDSIFQYLLPVDDNLKFMRKRVPVQRTRIDFVNSVFGETFGHGEFILHTKGPSNIGGGRTEFDSAEACLSAMRACIELSVSWSDLIIYSQHLPSYPFGICKLFVSGDELFCSGIKIKFPGTEYWEPSDSSRLRHILCSGKPPKKSTIPFDDPILNRMHPHYIEFLQLVRTQIIQIIQNSHSNPDCEYTIIPCCKTNPECNGKTLCRKYTGFMSKLATCGECNLDLCIGGCGRIYHGDTPCNISLDEASEAVILGTTKRCPNDRCNIPIYKSEGCNHMTCSHCRTEFCYICGDELPRDDNGRYSTVMHFNQGQFGIGREGGCNQFDH